MKIALRGDANTARWQ